LRDKDNSREITVMGNDNSSLACDGGRRTRAAGVMGLLYEKSSLGCDGNNSRVPIAGWSCGGVGPERGLRGGGRRGWYEEWARSS
jgi:hypothetical protein